MGLVGPWTFRPSIRALQHYAVIQHEKNRALISTFLTIKTTAYKLIKLVYNAAQGPQITTN